MIIPKSSQGCLNWGWEISDIKVWSEYLKLQHKIFITGSENQTALALFHGDTPSFIRLGNRLTVLCYNGALHVKIFAE